MNYLLLFIYFEPAKIQKSELIACCYWKMLRLERGKREALNLTS